MDANEFGRVFAGVSAYLNRNFDAERYHWKLKAPPKGLSKPAIATEMMSEYEARVFALACSFCDLTWWQITKPHTKIKGEWMKRLENPKFAVDELLKLPCESFDSLLEDSNRGAPIQRHLLSGNIHFVTFAFVILTTHCSKHWQSLYWKTQKEKILKIIRALDIDVAQVLQFASLLRKELNDQ